MHVLIEKKEAIRRDLLEFLSIKGGQNSHSVIPIFHKYGVEREYNLVHNFLQEMELEGLITYISTKSGESASITLSGLEYLEKGAKEYFTESEQDEISDIIDRVVALEQFQEKIIVSGHNLEKAVNELKEQIPGQKKSVFRKMFQGFLLEVMGESAYEFVNSTLIPMLRAVTGLIP